MPETLVYILTGPVQTGKTSSLMEWRNAGEELYGILAPIVNDKRVFRNIHTLSQFPMEAGEEEKETLAVGRFIFSRESFEKAAAIIRNGLNAPGWLIIDEIGPLELKGLGFAEVLKHVLAKRKGRLLLVVREGMVDMIKAHFGVADAIVITKLSAISGPAKS